LFSEKALFLKPYSAYIPHFGWSASSSSLVNLPPFGENLSKKTSAGKEMSWLNFMVAKMWPHIHEALKLVVAKDLEPKIKVSGLPGPELWQFVCWQCKKNGWP